ncbi:MAG: UbiD family decarboxylase [Gammaproteobacteria bacterium]|nr:UbiD family decarboxylase [Gammaproteobacteria bacterium]
MASICSSDMHEYIASLLARGEMQVVEKEVDPKYELAAVVSQSQKQSDKAILFKNVKGSQFPVIANIYGSFSRMAEMVGAKEEGLNEKWLSIFKGFSQTNNDYINIVPEPDDLQSGKLSELPSITWREEDAAPYITAGVFLANNPDAGTPNLSFSRCMMLNDDSKMFCCIDAPHDLAKYQSAAEANNESLEVAILIGAPPPVFLAAVASLPIKQDELQLAAQIAGGLLDMYACEHIDLLVPAASEIVIEATIRANERVEDGPFGEFLGYYCDVNKGAYVLDIKNVRWRKDAYYHGLLCGSREDLTALAVSWGNRIYRDLVDDFPGILDVTINPTLFGSIIKIDKQSEQHPRDVIDAVFRLNPLYNRMCIVVDKDIDIHDLESVWWSYLTRGNIDTRTHLFSDLPDVENTNYEFSGYLGIDATMSLDAKLKRSSTPGEHEINLDDYFST